MTTSLKILLTGGSGFVGSAILRDEFFKEAVSIGRTRPKHHSLHIYSEICADTVYRDLLKNVDIVVHAAGRAHVLTGDLETEKVLMNATNHLATVNLAKQCAAAGVKKFIFLSSVKVLGENTNDGEVFEHCSHLNPHGPYADSKAKAEKSLQQLMGKTQMKIVIIRPPMVYGDKVLGNFKTLVNVIQPILPIPVGSINNRRSFISVNNLVDFIKCCISSPGANDSTFLVSDDKDLSTAQLISMLSKKKLGYNAVIKFPVKVLRTIFRITGKSEVYEKLSASLQLDITETKSRTGWQPPKTPFEEIERLEL